jgi:hypothetical protein
MSSEKYVHPVRRAHIAALAKIEAENALAQTKAESRAEKELAVAILASCATIPNDPRIFTHLYPDLLIDRVPDDPAGDFVHLARHFLATVKPFCDSAEVKKLPNPGASLFSVFEYAEKLAEVCTQVFPRENFRRAAEWPFQHKEIVRKLVTATSELLLDACAHLTPAAWWRYICTLRFAVDELD